MHEHKHIAYARQTGAGDGITDRPRMNVAKAPGRGIHCFFGRHCALIALPTLSPSACLPLHPKQAPEAPPTPKHTYMHTCTPAEARPRSMARCGPVPGCVGTAASWGSCLGASLLGAAQPDSSACHRPTCVHIKSIHSLL